MGEYTIEGGGGGVAYRPMDRVEFSVVDSELQNTIKTLTNALMEGV